MPSDRRDFLTRLAAGTAASAAASALAISAFPGMAQAADVSMSAQPSGEPAFSYADAERAMDEAALAETWDTSWTQRLTGKHRAVFDSPAVSEGAGVIRSALWQRQYADVFKTQPGDLNSVIVLRHDAIVLAMAHPFWDEYGLGKESKIKDPLTRKTAKRNIANLTTADGASTGADYLSLDKQIANGTIVLACGLAFGGMVYSVQQKHKGMKSDEARAIAKEGLVKGVILQPSGFFATTLAGENGCVYVRAS